MHRFITFPGVTTDQSLLGGMSLDDGFRRFSDLSPANSEINDALVDAGIAPIVFLIAPEHDYAAARATAEDYWARVIEKFALTTQTASTASTVHDLTDLVAAWPHPALFNLPNVPVIGSRGLSIHADRPATWDFTKIMPNGTFDVYVHDCGTGNVYGAYDDLRLTGFTRTEDMDGWGFVYRSNHVGARVETTPVAGYNDDGTVNTGFLHDADLDPFTDQFPFNFAAPNVPAAYGDNTVDLAKHWSGCEDVRMVIAHGADPSAGHTDFYLWSRSKTVIDRARTTIMRPYHSTRRGGHALDPRGNILTWDQVLGVLIDSAEVDYASIRRVDTPRSPGVPGHVFPGAVEREIIARSQH